MKFTLGGGRGGILDKVLHKETLPRGSIPYIFNLYTILTGKVPFIEKKYPFHIPYFHNRPVL